MTLKVLATITQDLLCQCQMTHTTKSRDRAFALVINNYIDSDISQLRAVKTKYTVFGKEKGDSGTPHLQCYLYFANARSFASITKAHPRAHVEVAKGNPEQNRNYCIKGEQTKAEWDSHQEHGENWGRNAVVEEYGELPLTQRQKGDLEKKRYQRTWDLAKQGLIEEIDPDIRVRLYSTIKRIRSDHLPLPASQSTLDFHWFVGDSGTGKSRAARTENPVHLLKKRNKWWDGYTNQPCVIIEEWHPEVCLELQQMLKEWCDHHPFCAEIKGGTMMIRPPKVIVTSNYTITQCFGHDIIGLLEPLTRRFQIREFKFE